MRMLMIVGVPWPLVFLGLIAVSAVVSWRLMASRVFVVMLISGGYFLTYLLTQSPEAVVTVDENPPIWDLARSSMFVCLPFALPALGSMIALEIEKRQDKRAKDEEVLTEEDLLAEKIPVLKRDELDYDLRDAGESHL